jgi:hypothetical protein
MRLTRQEDLVQSTFFSFFWVVFQNPMGRSSWMIVVFGRIHLFCFLKVCYTRIDGSWGEDIGYEGEG